MTDALIDTEPTIRIGRTRTLHRPRVVIEDDGGKSFVVVRTRCGLDVVDGDYGTGVVTCEGCEVGL